MEKVKWVPAQLVTSKIQDRLSATDYGTDLAFTDDGDMSFENGDLAMVSGVDTFKQHFLTTILPEKDDFTKWAIESKIFEDLNGEEFQDVAAALASDLVSHSHFDQLLNQQYGLGHTIESIISIARNIEENGKPVLLIELTATGVNAPLIVRIPFLTL